MSPVGTEWVLLTRCVSVGHAELLVAALGKAGLGSEIRGRHLTAVQAMPVAVWVQARNGARANEVLRELAEKADEGSVVCRGCREENPANFETCWSCGVVLPVERR